MKQRFNNRSSVCAGIKALAQMTGHQELVPTNLYRKPEDDVRDIYRTLNKIAKRMELRLK